MNSEQTKFLTKSEIYGFVFKIFLLFLPVFIILGIPLLVFILGRELYNISHIENLQRNNSKLVLYGPAYSDYQMRLKWLAVKERKPKIVALGTSRVMQFRKEFFKSSISFYNAGGGIGKMSDLKKFIMGISSDYNPELILLGLDHNFFNDSWIKSAEVADFDQMKHSDIKRREILITKWKKIYEDYCKGKFQFRTLMHRRDNFFGLNAVVKHNGFRNDGSYMYGYRIKAPNDPNCNEDYNFSDTFERIKRGKRRFEYGNKVSNKAVSEMEAFLKCCRDRGIYVCAFLPPYAHAVLERMRSMGENYAYVWEIAGVVNTIFTRYGFSFWDFSDIASLGARDEEAIDGFHGSEKVYLRMWLKMQEDNPQLSNYSVATETLWKLISQHTTNPLVVFADKY